MEEHMKMKEKVNLKGADEDKDGEDDDQWNEDEDD